MHSSLILNLREIITIIMYVGKLSAKHRTNHLTTLTMRQGIVHHSISITMKILHWILLLMVISTIILLLWQMRVSTEPYSGKVKWIFVLNMTFWMDWLMKDMLTWISVILKGVCFCHRWLLVLHGQTKCQIVVRIPLLTY